MKQDRRWQRVKKHLVVFTALVAAVYSYYLVTTLFQPVLAVRIGLMGVLLLLLVIIGGYVYNWNWTGVGQADYPKKTLWDWMQLLIVPVLLAIGGFWFSQVQSINEQRRAEERAQTDRAIATENQREAVLQTYLDQMAELLLDRGIRTSSPGSEVREIARIRTLTVLRRLDSPRRTIVFNFLHDAGLVSPDPDSIITFERADLPRVDLSDTVIGSVNLTEAVLADANLAGASLLDANLAGAFLVTANLTGAGLRDADMTGAVLDSATLAGASVDGATLTNAYLREATLTDASLFEVDLTDAFMWGADLTDTVLLDTDLTGADLKGATLTGADLTHAVLIGADLTDATLWDADLTNADLTNATLTNAYLLDAIVTQDQLLSCRTLRGATLPDGTKVPADQDFPAGWK